MAQNLKAVRQKIRDIAYYLRTSGRSKTIASDLEKIAEYPSYSTLQMGVDRVYQKAVDHKYTVVANLLYDIVAELSEYKQGSRRSSGNSSAKT